jgi:phosphoglycolate phosphatase-like HAD superfamily hydrolase
VKRCNAQNRIQTYFLLQHNASTYRSRERWWFGDSVWDLLAARRAGCLGIGLLSGGYGKEELEQVGAYRVYQDPADLLTHLDEVGVRITD